MERYVAENAGNRGEDVGSNPQESRIVAFTGRKSFEDYRRNINDRVRADIERLSDADVLNSDANHLVEETDERIAYVNQVVAPIVGGGPRTLGEEARPFAEHLLGERRAKAQEKRTQAVQFRQQARELGIELTERPDAVRPVDIRVKDEILVLRQPAPDAAEVRDPRVAPETVAKIVRLIDQVGRGF